MNVDEFFFYKDEKSPSFYDNNCIGIAGGPVVIRVLDKYRIKRYRLAGVLLDGHFCWSERIALRISFYKNWINEIIKETNRMQGNLPGSGSQSYFS